MFARLKSIAGKERRVAVLVCGPEAMMAQVSSASLIQPPFNPHVTLVPEAMMAQVRRLCWSESHGGDTSFDYHGETFAF